MSTLGKHTRREIMSQPEAWLQAMEVAVARREGLQRLWADTRPDAVIWTGCGSTYYLAMAVASLMQSLTGVPARAFPASELLLYPEAVYPAGQRVLLVAVSRSGSTTETVAAVERFRKRVGGDVVTFSCYGDAPLARMGNINLLIPAGKEESVAQTRSFAAMYVAAAVCNGIFAAREDLVDACSALPAAGEELLSTYGALAARYGENLQLDRVYFLGSGPRYGLACEGALKMKEMSLTHAEPFHLPEFRHGPKAMVTPATLVVGLVEQADVTVETAVLQEAAALGADTLLLAAGADSARADAAGVSLPAEIPPPIRGVLYLPVLQLMAYHRAVKQGLDPDRPRHLDSVVRLDGGWE